VPIPADQARPRSMSAHYGQGAFPYHTDGANFSCPPRYILLRAVLATARDRPTLMVDSNKWCLSEEDRSRLQQDVWYVNGGRGRFLTSILFHSDQTNGSYLRYDPCCMWPAHARFTKSARIMQAHCNSHTRRVLWEPGRALIIDNWRVLHARPTGPDNSSERRVLERVFVHSGRVNPR